MTPGWLSRSGLAVFAAEHLIRQAVVGGKTLKHLSRLPRIGN
jgi:hypothetical protein